VWCPVRLVLAWRRRLLRRLRDRVRVVCDRRLRLRRRHGRPRSMELIHCCCGLNLGSHRWWLWSTSCRLRGIVHGWLMLMVLGIWAGRLLLRMLLIHGVRRGLSMRLSRILDILDVLLWLVAWGILTVKALRSWRRL
jgi:hypothetical protein